MESWKIISNFSKYLISDFGRVMNKERGNILKPSNGTYNMVLLLSDAGQTKNLYVHRLVAQAFLNNPDNKRCVDHIDGNKYNNNVTNLRWSTPSENQANRKPSLFTSSDYKGVSLHKPSGKWLVHINIDRKCTHIGLYDDEIEAAKAYNSWAVISFGEFARLNNV